MFLASRSPTSFPSCVAGERLDLSSKMYLLILNYFQEESSETKMKIRRELRRSDLMVRESLLANYKAAVEEKELDEPITKRDIDTLKAEMEKVCDVIPLA